MDNTSDVRIVKTFPVEGKNIKECDKKANEEFDNFRDGLSMEEA